MINLPSRVLYTIIHQYALNTNGNWVYDICQEYGYEVLLANPNQDAWQWRNVKRKTDKDDALKLAKLAALEQITPVYNTFLFL